MLGFTESQNTRISMSTEELARLLDAKIQAFQDRFHEVKNQELSEHSLSQLEADWKEVNDAIVVLKFMMTIPEDSEVIVERETEEKNLAEQEKEEPTIPVMRIVEEFEESIAEDAEEIAVEEPLPVQDEIETEPETPEIIQSQEPEVVHEIEEPFEKPAEETVSEPEVAIEEIVQEAEKVTSKIEGEVEEIAREVEEQIVQVEELVVDEKVTATTAEPVVDRNEQLKQEDNSLANRLKKSPITDLKASIGLNQRFLFSNELFNGNMEAFNRAINEINHMESFEDAKRYLEIQVAPQYHWNLEGETVLEFQELVERRFM